MGSDNITNDYKIVTGKEMLNAQAKELEREKEIFNVKFSSAMDAYSKLLTEVERCSSIKIANELFEKITYHIAWFEEIKTQYLLHDEIQIKSRDYKQDKVFSNKVKISINRYSDLFNGLDEMLKAKLKSINNNKGSDNLYITKDADLVAKLYDFMRECQIIDPTTNFENFSFAFTGQHSENSIPEPIHICNGKKTAFREIISFIEHGIISTGAGIENCKNPSAKYKKIVSERFVFSGKSQKLDHFKKDEHSSDITRIERFFLSIKKQ